MTLTEELEDVKQDFIDMLPSDNNDLVGYERGFMSGISFVISRIECIQMEIKTGLFIAEPCH